VYGYVFVRVYIYTYIYVYTYTYIYVYIYIYVYLYTYIFINIYIYTHIHIYIFECDSSRGRRDCVSAIFMRSMLYTINLYKCMYVYIYNRANRDQNCIFTYIYTVSAISIRYIYPLDICINVCGHTYTIAYIYIYP